MRPALVFFSLILVGCDPGAVLLDDDDDDDLVDDDSSDDDDDLVDDDSSDDDDVVEKPCDPWGGSWTGHLYATTQCHNFPEVTGSCDLVVEVNVCAVSLVSSTCDPALQLYVVAFDGQLDEESGEGAGSARFDNDGNDQLVPWADAGVHYPIFSGELPRTDNGNCAIEGTWSVYDDLRDAAGSAR